MRKRRTVDDEWVVLLRQTRDGLKRAVLAFARSRDTAVLTSTLTHLLVTAHSRAAYLGRRKAGSQARYGDLDEQFGAAVMLGQQEYLSRLISDLSGGRYDLTQGVVGELSVRLEWWARRVRGTAEEAWVRTSPGSTLLDWVTTALESCPDCLDMEARNPHRADQLDKYPGSFQTECLGNCKCFLSIVGGGQGFRIPEGA